MGIGGKATASKKNPKHLCSLQTISSSCENVPSEGVINVCEGVSTWTFGGKLKTMASLRTQVAQSTHFIKYLLSIK